MERHHAREDLRAGPVEGGLVVRAHHRRGHMRPHIGVGLAMPIGTHLAAEGGEKVRIGVHVAAVEVLHECGHGQLFHEVAEVRRERIGEDRDGRLVGYRQVLRLGRRSASGRAVPERTRVAMSIGV